MNELLEIMKFKNLIDLSIEYYTKSLQPLSKWDIFMQYGVPIIEMLAIVMGVFIAICTYRSTKNKETYEKLLTEVYGPMYQYLVRQETYRKMVNLTVDYHEAPILEITKKTTTTKYDNGNYSVSSKKETVLNLDRKTFLEVLEGVNVGLAPQTLLTLLNMYQTLIYMEENFDKEEYISLNSAVLIVDVENKLRKEIISGYQKYHKLLNIKSGVKNDFLRVSEDQIDILLYPSGVQKDLLLKEYQNKNKN